MLTLWHTYVDVDVSPLCLSRVWPCAPVEFLKINDQSRPTLSTTPKNVHTRRHPLRIIPRVGVVYVHHLTVRASHHIAEVIVLAQREQAREHLGKRVRAAFGDG